MKVKINEAINKILNSRVFVLFVGVMLFIKTIYFYKNTIAYKEYGEMIIDYNILKEEYEQNYGEIQYNFEGILENKNILIVQLESVQEFVAHKTIKGKEITPNLNRFLDENIEFTNMHMQSYSSTADSEYTMITSTYPMENGMSFSKYFLNTYDNIFEMFNNKNYYTSYMHGNVASFWNRGNVYSRMSLNETVFLDEFEDQSEMISGYLSDELFYKQAVEKIKNHDTPFMTFLVSSSSHTAFDLPGLEDRDSKINIDVGKYNDTLLIFGDHNGLSMYDEELQDFLKESNPYLTDIDLKLNYTRVLCGMKIPAVKEHI